MKSSTRKLVSCYHGSVTLAVVASLVVLGGLGSAVIGSVSPAQGYVSAPYLICFGDSQSNLRGLEGSLAPAEGATAQVGTLVTFTGGSGASLKFAVASSPALLSSSDIGPDPSPDIGSGPGSAQQQPGPPGSPPTYTYTFTSTRAAIAPRTVYWDASFSNATLAGCEGLAPTTYTTPIRTLTILPAPSPPTAPPPTSPPPAEPPPLQVSIRMTSSFHLAHPTVTYRIHCTASCSGGTSYQVFVLRHHAKAVRASKLDLGRESVSIIPATGGDEQFTHNYSGNSLQTLRTIVRTGGILEFRITAKVTGALGNVARAQHIAQLRT